jgi:tetratricopeptide (TPR) repeat protein
MYQKAAQRTTNCTIVAILPFLIFTCMILLLPSIAFSQQGQDERYKLAQTYENGGDFRNAARLFQELYAQFPSNEVYFGGVARSLLQLQRFAELLPLAENHAAKYPGIEIYALLGQLYWRTTQQNKAEQAWEKAIAQMKSLKDPQSIEESAIVIAQSQSTLGLASKAIQTFLQARKAIGNTSAQILFAEELSKLYALTGDYTAGAIEVLTLFRQSRNYGNAQGRFSALMTSPEAIDHIRRVLKSKAEEEQEYPIQKLYLWFLRETKELDAALETAEKIDMRNRLSGRELLEFADISSRDGQFDIALKAYGRVIDRGKGFPSFSPALYGYAKALENKIGINSGQRNRPTVNPQEIQDIITRYQYIIAQFPGTQNAADCQYRIGMLKLYYLKDLDDALTEFRRLATQYPQYSITASGNNELAGILLTQNNIKEYIEVLRRNASIYATINTKESDRSSFMLAELEYFQGSIDSALAHLAPLAAKTESDIANDALERSLFIEQNKQYTGGLITFASAEFAEKQQNHDKAMELFRQVQTTNSDTDLGEIAAMRMAENRQNTGNRQAAISMYNEFLKSYPESNYSDKVLFNLADIQAADSPAESIKLLTDILARYPRSMYLQQAREKIRKLRGDS